MQKAFCLHNRMLGFKSKLFQVREKYICHIVFRNFLSNFAFKLFTPLSLYFCENDAPKLIQASY